MRCISRSPKACSTNGRISSSSFPSSATQISRPSMYSSTSASCWYWATMASTASLNCEGLRTNCRPMAHHAKVWRRHAGIADKLLGDHFVERQGVTERARPGVGDAGHLQHGRDMCVATLALNSIGHVEDHPGGAALRTGRQKAPERGEHFLIA